MVWAENYREGNYDEKHMPPTYKRYFAPKPWEVLNTGARPDTPKQKKQFEVEPIRAEPVRAEE